MVAKINTSGNLYGVLLCNLQKVDKNSGTVLTTHIIREPTVTQLGIDKGRGD